MDYEKRDVNKLLSYKDVLAVIAQKPNVWIREVDILNELKKNNNEWSHFNVSGKLYYIQTKKMVKVRKILAKHDPRYIVRYEYMFEEKKNGNTTN
jgi:hypothetical protein